MREEKVRGAHGSMLQGLTKQQQTLLELKDTGESTLASLELRVVDGDGRRYDRQVGHIQRPLFLFLFPFRLLLWGTCGGVRSNTWAQSWGVGPTLRIESDSSSLMSVSEPMVFGKPFPGDGGHKDGEVDDEDVSAEGCCCCCCRWGCCWGCCCAGCCLAVRSSFRT